MNPEPILNEQREFFATGRTLPVGFRKKALRRLLRFTGEYEDRLCAALEQDLGKSRSESYMCELALVKSEIRHMLRHLSEYAAEALVPTPLANAVARSSVRPCPYGCVLIVSPWNYPFLLTMGPLVDALAAGNTAVLKPSAYSPHTSRVMADMMAACFPRKYVAVVTGGREENAELFAADFDTIFFTGSKAVGREVLRQAAEHTTPVTLELGGKSPCIVDESALLGITAKRIVFGKFLNCGQTCVAPDYILCHARAKDRLVAELKKQISAQYGENPLENPTYGKIINEKHFDRLSGLISPEKVVHGGQCQRETLRIAPTILDGVTWDDPIMQEEIFGPILPILTYENLDDAIRTVRDLPHPLALYIFSTNRGHIRRWKREVSFGGGCVNDTIIHLATSEMGFGGVGASGMGAYHGKRGFDTFTHYKSMVDRSPLVELPIRYQPYRKWKDLAIRIVVR